MPVRFWKTASLSAQCYLIFSEIIRLCVVFVHGGFSTTEAYCRLATMASNIFQLEEAESKVVLQEVYVGTAPCANKKKKVTICFKMAVDQFLRLECQWTLVSPAERLQSPMLAEVPRSQSLAYYRACVCF